MPCIEAFLDEFDMEIQEEEILANKESKAGEDDMSVQEQEIIDNETAEKEILENDAAIESAKVDEIKEEENLLQKEVHEDKIEPGLAEEEIALLEETLEKEKKVEKETNFTSSKGCAVACGLQPKTYLKRFACKLKMVITVVETQ